MSTVRRAIPEDAPAIARVHVDSWRETYTGLIPDEVLQGLDYQQRESYWNDTLTEGSEAEFAFVAEDDGGQVIGFVSGGPERQGNLPFSGEIYAIYLLQAHQGQGWGRKLFRAAVEHLVGAGMSSMMLWVHRDSPTRGFYEAMGGKRFDEQSTWIGEAELILVAYGWLGLEP